MIDHHLKNSAGGSIRELRTEIQISAPIDQVWQVLTDFENWKDWNPTIKQASGNASLGSKLNITMAGEDCKEMSYQPCVLKVNPPSIFRWRATMMAGFLFTNYRVFELKEKDGGTQFTHKKEFSGLIVPMFWKKLNQFVLPMLEKMDKALKDKLEA